MGAKKKGLANRLAKMSDEDRARYLQHRADMEEEARRRKEQLISMFLKNKLKKEEAFARLNVAKINQSWHQIMRKQKCKVMKEEVQNMRTQMERVLDLKNRTIERLIRELDEAEDQYGNNFQSHLNHVTEMIDFGYKSLDEMHESYERDRKEILEEGRKERRAFLEKALDETVYLKTLIYQKGECSKKELRENYEYYFKKSDDVIRQNKEEFELMRQQKESVIGDLWRDIAAFLRGHVDATDVKRAHLAELQSLDAESAAEIARNEETIKRQEEEIVVLEQQFEDLKKSKSAEIRELTEHARAIKKEHLEVKIRLKKELDTDDKRILFLTSTSNETIQYLEKLKDKGEKLLQLVQICRKHETQEEKVLRFANEAESGKYLNFDGDDNGGYGRGSIKHRGGDKDNVTFIKYRGGDGEQLLDDDYRVSDGRKSEEGLCLVHHDENNGEPSITRNEGGKKLLKSGDLSGNADGQEKVLRFANEAESGKYLNIGGDDNGGYGRGLSGTVTKHRGDDKDNATFIKYRGGKGCADEQFLDDDFRVSDGRKSKDQLCLIHHDENNKEPSISINEGVKKLLKSGNLSGNARIEALRNSGRRIRKSCKIIKALKSRNAITKTSNSENETVNRKLQSDDSYKITNRKSVKTAGNLKTPQGEGLDFAEENGEAMTDCFTAVNKLEGLWNAYNRVLINCMEMRRERRCVLEENERLKGVIRSVLEAAVLEKISHRLELTAKEEYVRDIHSADAVYKGYNVTVLN